MSRAARSESDGRPGGLEGLENHDTGATKDAITALTRDHNPAATGYENGSPDVAAEGRGPWELVRSIQVGREDWDNCDMERKTRVVRIERLGVGL